MTEEAFIELASRYVAGVATSEEMELIDSLVKEPQYAQLFRKVNTVWLDAGRAARKKKFDSERGLDRLAEKLRHHEPAFRWGPNRRRFPAPNYRAMQFGIAAAIVCILILAGLRLLKIDTGRQAEPVIWSEKKAQMGQKAVVVLPDGSSITLNGGSRLTYPAKFDRTPRMVFLEGEAYFDIRHDAAHPFIIHAGSIAATDLGTKFTVRAFASESTLTVSLEEGSVQVAPSETGSRHKGVILAPLQQFVYNKDNGGTGVRSFDPKRVSGWKENLYVFDDAPLSEVFREMERAYGVKFELAEASYGARRIRVHFTNESVWTAAEILKKAAGLTTAVVRDGDRLKTIIFSKK